jgi:hypothetical protein
MAALLMYLSTNDASQVRDWLRNNEMRFLSDARLATCWMKIMIADLDDPVVRERLLSLPSRLAKAKLDFDAISSVTRAMADGIARFPEAYSATLERAREANDIQEAEIWLHILGELGDDPRLVLIGLEVGKRFGLALGIIESLFPFKEDSNQMQFRGCFAGHGTRQYRFQHVVSALGAIALVGTKEERRAASKALFWIERERLANGPHAIGSRTCPNVGSIHELAINMYSVDSPDPEEMSSARGTAGSKMSIRFEF